MYSATYEKIYGKPTDYKLCNDCKAFNYYDNDECCRCGCREFKEREEDVITMIESEYDFYMNEEGYTEDEVDLIEIDT